MEGSSLLVTPPPVRDNRPRPVLFFNHNPKAGGGSIIEVLQDSMTNCNSLKRLKKIDGESFDYARTAPCYKRVREFDATSYADRQRGFVMGSIREPCSHYLSLWAFGSTNQGDLRWKLRKKYPERVQQEYGIDAPYYNTTGDVARFHQWLRSEEIRGLLTKRFVKSYVDVVPQVDCWVYVEFLQASLVDCLRRYEAQGGRVDWGAPKLSALVQMTADGKEHSHGEEDRRKLLTDGENKYVKNDAAGNPQTSHHAPCATYFDANASSFVENGPDSILYGLFGYEGCCSREIVLPPHSTTTSSSRGIAQVQTGHSKEVRPCSTTSTLGISMWAPAFMAFQAIIVFVGIRWWARSQRKQQASS